MPLNADADERKENEDTVRIPLRLSDESDSRGQGWKIVRFENVPPNKVACGKDGLHIQVPGDRQRNSIESKDVKYENVL